MEFYEPVCPLEALTDGCPQPDFLDPAHAAFLRWLQGGNARESVLDRLLYGTDDFRAAVAREFLRHDERHRRPWSALLLAALCTIRDPALRAQLAEGNGRRPWGVWRRL